MRPLTDASAASLHPFATDFIRPGATVITGGRRGCCGLDKRDSIHRPYRQRAVRACGEDPGQLPPGVHRVAAPAKRWLLGTHLGAVDKTHLASYLNEFVFRFNRRRSRRRGMVFYRVLELAAAHQPVHDKDLVTSRRSRTVPPTPPKASGHPPSPERPPATAPGETPVKWRVLTPL